MRIHVAWVVLLLGCRAPLDVPQAWLGPSEDTDGEATGGGSDKDKDEPACAAAERGPAPLRRLTRREYVGTVDALFGIAVDPEALPEDDLVGPFPANAVVPVGELAVESYIAVAETVAAEIDVAAVAPDGDLGFLDALLPRALRRPVDEDERAAFEAVFAAGEVVDGFDGGVRAVVAALLQAPSLLYRPESGDETHRLLGRELATRLAFVITGRPPDDDLVAAAEDGTLDRRSGVEEEAQRLLASTHGPAQRAAFVRRWLGVDQLADTYKDPAAYPDYDDALRDAMVAELDAFAASARSLPALFTSRATEADESLQALYGITGDELPAGERAGVLTRAAVLATHAHPDQSAPTPRGVLIRERILCEDLPTPPADVDNIPPAPDNATTTRQRFERHRDDPACAACHELIDPLGFALEHYDGIGRYRETDAGAPVDATGKVTAEDGWKASFEDAIELSEELAEAEPVRRCFARQFFQHALGRPVVEADTCVLEGIDEAFAASDYDIDALVVAIVTSDAFLFLPEGP